MLVVGVWYFLRADDYDTPELAFIVTLIKVADIALLVYTTNYLLIPFLLYKKKYLLFAVAFIAIVFISSILKMNLLGWMLNNYALINWTENFKERLYDNILPHFFLVIAGAAIKLMFDNGKLQQRMAEAAKEKSEAELNFLKSQINPHFIFNSLNAVYFLINKENALARDALHKFSDMLRYQLYEMNGDKIPVEKEIRYLKDYMDLQQLRKDEKYSVQFNCSPEVKNFTIEPLLLIPFVENAFKHISHHSEGDNYVKANMNKSNETFFFTIENSTDGNKVKEQNGGIGLNNVKRRLALLYPGKHDLLITETDEKYSVQLNINLHEN